MPGYTGCLRCGYWHCRCFEPVEPEKWAQFTKRTNDPKLEWLETKMDEAGIRSRRNGESFHVPILEVDAARLDDEWAILEPVDDIEDDDPMFL